MLMRAVCERADGWRDLLAAWHEYLAAYRPYRPVLVIPPDITRLHSGAGMLTAELYAQWNRYAPIHIMPALGTHRPLTAHELRVMFGDAIPHTAFLTHHWRRDVVTAAHLSTSDMRDVLTDDERARIPPSLITDMPVELNRAVVDSRYGHVVSIGQVAPHEVFGMAGYVKNIMIGCGGQAIIDRSHILGASIGMDSIIGRVDTGIRRITRRAFDMTRRGMRTHFALTVIGEHATGAISPRALIIGDDEECFQDAARIARTANIIHVPHRYHTVVAFMPPNQYRSLWVANKALYRLADIVADDGELLIIAPAVDSLAEQRDYSHLIARYGYRGRASILSHLTDPHHELSTHAAAAAHLIHGSSEGRFRVTYCTDRLSDTELRNIGYHRRPLATADRYRPFHRPAGVYSTAHGEEYYFVSNPGFRLWRYAPADAPVAL